jgi:hypothetical protein
MLNPITTQRENINGSLQGILFPFVGRDNKKKESGYVKLPLRYLEGSRMKR